MANLISSALSLARRKSAPFGDSSRSFSPFAKAPWQSEHPLFRHAARPAFTLSSFCANTAVEQVKAMVVTIRMAVRVPQRGSQHTTDRTFKLDSIPASSVGFRYFGSSGRTLTLFGFTDLIPRKFR